MPFPPSREADDSAQIYYDLPILSWKAIPDDYERDVGEDKKDEKFERGDILVVEAG